MLRLSYLTKRAESAVKNDTRTDRNTENERKGKRGRLSGPV